MTKVDPNAPLADNQQARLNRPVYRITIFCKEKNSLTTAENVRSASFQCPLCQGTLVYLAAEHRLGAHGHSSTSMRHELRKAQTIGTIASTA